MKTKLLSFIFVLFCLLGQAVAQQRQVTGKVTSAVDRSPLAGVSVTVAGTNVATQTDNAGNYAINVASNGTLVFTYLGFQSQSIPVNNKTVLHVELLSSSTQIEEIVVLPYQTVDARAVTGAVSSVGSSTLAKQTVPSVTRALQGATTGTQVLTSVGQPGENATIRIRGINSINASASPLVVVDGVPYGGNISSINQADVENMTVLKDAASAALYGSRAANGVIMIQTKMGRVGEPKLEASITRGYSSRARKEYKLLNAAQSMQLTWEALRNYGQANKVADPGTYASDNIIAQLRYNPYNVAKPFDKDGNLVAGAQLLWDTDWEKALTRSASEATRTEAQFSATGGSDKSKYFVSFGYLNDKGLAISSEFERISGRINLTNKLKNWLELGTNLNLSKSEQNYPTQSGSSYGNVVQFYRSLSNIYPLYMRDDKGALILDDNKSPMYDWGTTLPGRTVNHRRPLLDNENPAGTYVLNKTSYGRLVTTANTYAEATIIEGLKYKSTFGIDFYNYYSNEFSNPNYGVGASVGGRGVRRKDNTTQWTWTNQLSYNKTFAEKHNFNAFVVYESFNYAYEGLTGQKTGFQLEGLTELSAGTNNETLTSSLNEERLLSYLGKAGYNYSYRYFIDASFRRDGSSRFYKDNRWGTFYSISGAWAISEENFLKNIEPITNMKLRVSYGELGNNFTLYSNGNQNYFPFMSSYGTGYNMLDNAGVILETLPNYNLSWEKNRTFNIGLDFGLLKNRLTGAFDWYKKVTDGLIFSRPLPDSGGIPSIIENIGEMNNSGFELTLNSTNINNQNFSWNTSLFLSRNKNKITKLYKGQGINTGDKRYEEGRSAYDFYLEQWAGVNPSTGQPEWFKKVKNSDGKESLEKTSDYSEASTAREFVGSSLPDLTLGLTNDLSYKDFSLSFNIYANIGGKMYDSDYASLMRNYRSHGYQSSIDILGRWQKEGDVTDIPQIGVNQDANGRSTRFLYDATFVRVRYINFGYSLPKNLISRIKANHIRLFVQADNPFTFYKRKGIDPEQSLEGNTSNRSSQMKTIAFGLNVGL